MCKVFSIPRRLFAKRYRTEFGPRGHTCSLMYFSLNIGSMVFKLTLTVLLGLSTKSNLVVTTVGITEYGLINSELQVDTLAKKP